jgi:hypothetical protein
VNAGRSDLALVVLAAGEARRYGGCKPLAPVGPNGEAIIDLVASDAVAAGFSTIVLVLSPSTGPAIRYHVEQVWPESVDVRFCEQATPRGTVDAVASAWSELDPSAPYGVANADDLYGPAPLALLAAHLATGSADQALVGFRLSLATIGASPVTRGVCRVSPEGYLAGIDERRQVAPDGAGGFQAGDGRSPSNLDGDALVSMNLWGFTARVRPAFESALSAAAGDAGEVLLPEVVGRLIGTASTAGVRFGVLAAETRCVGVTHPDDLSLVQEAIARQVGRGERPATAWSSVPARP